MLAGSNILLADAGALARWHVESGVSWGVALVVAVAFTLALVILWSRVQTRWTTRAGRARFGLWCISGLLLVAMTLDIRVVKTQWQPAPMAVLLDDSLSMAVVVDEPSASEKSTRFEAARRWFEHPHDFGVPVVKKRLPIASRRTPRAAGPSSETSPVAEGIIDSVRAQPAPSAVVVLTDGRNTGPVDYDAAIASARVNNTALFFFVPGGDASPMNVALRRMTHARRTYPGDAVSVTVSLAWQGLAEQRSIDLVLRDARDDSLLRRETVAIGPEKRGTRRAVVFFRAGKGGTLPLSLRLDAPLDMLGTDDQLESTIEVVDTPVRVLIVQGEPTLEYRFLKATLAREAGFDVDVVLQSADPRHAAQDESVMEAMPATAAALRQYDVIVLGDPDADALSAPMHEALAEFVLDADQGGGILAIAGPRRFPWRWWDTPLGDILPFFRQEVSCPDPDAPLVAPLHVVATPVGSALAPMQIGPITQQVALGDGTVASPLAGLAPCYWHLWAPRLKDGAVVLAELRSADHSSRDGEGTEHPPAITYQRVGAGQMVVHHFHETWRWRRGEDLARYERYWLQMIRSLAPIREPGSAEGETTVAEESPMAYDEELAELRPAWDQLGRAASVTGGAVAPLGQADAVLSAWEPRVSRRIVDSQSDVHLGRTWWAFALLVVVLMADWILAGWMKSR